MCIWHVKIYSLPSKIFFHEMSCSIFTTQVMAFPQHMTFPQDVGFPQNESWHLHTTCMIVVIHTIIQQQTYEKSYYSYMGSYVV